MGDQDPVIGDRHSLRYAGPDPPLHLLLAQCAASAVNNEPVGSHILRKLGARSELELRADPGMLSDPCRQFLRSDIPALPVVRAAFGNEDPVAILYAVDSEGAAADRPEIPLISRHED